MNKVFILTGLIGAGKSTWAREYIKNSEKVIIINRDSIRKMLNGDIYVYNINLEALVRSIARETLSHSLDYGVDIIIDETNITKQKRQSWINLIRENNKDTEIVCVYCSEKEKNLERRKKDDRGISFEIWEKVYKHMLETFEEPTTNEEFDEIIEVK
jgi:predicted kinase